MKTPDVLPSSSRIARAHGLSPSARHRLVTATLIRCARRPRLLCCLLITSSLAACGQWVAPMDGSTSDAVSEATLADVVRDNQLDVVDRDADGAVDEDLFPDVADVTVRPDSSSCEAPAEPRPARSLRSCSGPNGAPAEHCREVWSCGGLTPMGSTEAFSYNALNQVIPQMAGCELGRVDVHPGFVDAYEVSVARFRAWALAGYPQPPDGTPSSPWPRLFDQDMWRHVNFEAPIRNCPPSDPFCPNPPVDLDNCTYRPTPGTNDHLPVNCVDILHAYAFCWWEGKHVVTEAAWEAIATNRGTTRRPFASGALGTFDECMFADVASCPRTGSLPLPIDARPLGQSLDPAGVLVLWGGVRELTLPINRTARECLIGIDQPETFDRDFGRIQTLRGRSYRDTGAVAMHYDHAATRGNPAGEENYDRARIGFRCARWVPEPTDLRE